MMSDSGTGETMYPTLVHSGLSGDSGEAQIVFGSVPGGSSNKLSARHACLLLSRPLIFLSVSSMVQQDASQ
jgi:hypothetical protein